MNEYEVGRDVQVLSSRIEHLEAVFGGCSPEQIRKDGLTARQEVSAGVGHSYEPLHWKPKEAIQLSPFLPELLGVPQRIAQFNVLPESKTWKEMRPLVLSINWDTGGSDEFYRFREIQQFSITRVREPNSGHVSCTATYSARLVASGKATSQLIPGIGYSVSQLSVKMLGAQGQILALFHSPPYSIRCHDDYEFVEFWDFNAGLYDLVAGATWEVVGIQYVNRC